MLFDIIPVWRNVTPELQAELADFWVEQGAIPDRTQAEARAPQAVCIARDAGGKLCAVATAAVRVIPRLRQPTYYFRQYLAPKYRGRYQALPFFEAACKTLEDANREKPESLGILMEIENTVLDQRFTKAVGQLTGGVFIGYSPRGLQLRVRYFEGATLFPPAPVRRTPARPVTS